MRNMTFKSFISILKGLENIGRGEGEEAGIDGGGEERRRRRGEILILIEFLLE
jgi:hypothetical protein